MNMFGKQPPDEPPLTQQEVGALNEGETVIVKPQNSPPSEWTILTEGTVRVATKFGMRLVLEPVGDGPEDIRVWRAERAMTDGFELDTEAIVSGLENSREDKREDEDRG